MISRTVFRILEGFLLFPGPSHHVAEPVFLSELAIKRRCSEARRRSQPKGDDVVIDHEAGCSLVISNASGYQGENLGLTNDSCWWRFPGGGFSPSGYSQGNDQHLSRGDAGLERGSCAVEPFTPPCLK